MSVFLFHYFIFYKPVCLCLSSPPHPQENTPLLPSASPCLLLVSLRWRLCCSRRQVTILGGEPAQKETDISLPATNYWDSPNTEAIQGEAPANINPLGLCKQREGARDYELRREIASL